MQLPLMLVKLHKIRVLTRCKFNILDYKCNSVANINIVIKLYQRIYAFVYD